MLFTDWEPVLEKYIPEVSEEVWDGRSRYTKRLTYFLLDEGKKNF